MKLILKILDYFFLISAVIVSTLFGIITLLWFPALLTQSFVLNILVINLFIILFFTPAILITVIFLVAKKYNGKNSKLLKILSYFLICALIFFHPVISRCYVIYEDYMDKKEPYNPIRPISEYNKFAENRTLETSHFPDKIPKTATNAEFYRNYMFHGDVEEYLKFNIDDEYINNELKHYHYTTIITGDKYTGHPPRGRDRDKDDVYYILDDLLEVHRGYSYGIVVNKKTHEIIYYYSSY